MRDKRFIITAVLFILLYLPVFPWLLKEWSAMPDYSHGFLIPLVSIYFLWKKREELKKTPISPSAIGFLYVCAGLILYMLARMGFQFFLQAFSMLIVLFGLVYAQAGLALAKKTAFSIAYLIFMIPLPQLVYTTITFHLGLLSTKAAFFFVRLFGIGATREGNIINLPTCQLVVAAPCSGIRGLIIYLAASFAIGYIFQRSILKRVVLVLIAVILAFVMNTVRLLATALIADMLKVTEIPQAIHDRTGIITTIIGFMLLFWINDLLTKKK